MVREGMLWPQRPGSSLYESLMGPAVWSTLPAIVRRLHHEGSATGRFTIRRGRGPLSAVVGWLCRFPSPGEDVPTRLKVRRDGPVQHWERDFGGHALATAQWLRAEGMLVEKLGPVECVFRLHATGQGLLFESVGAWLRLGPLRLRIPTPIAPRIDAITTALADGMHVRVSIGMALTGGLLTYEGLVRPEEKSP
jgi:hypothetical protein